MTAVVERRWGEGKLCYTQNEKEATMRVHNNNFCLVASGHCGIEILLVISESEWSCIETSATIQNSCYIYIHFYVSIYLFFIYLYDKT